MANPLIPADGVYDLSANKLNICQECPFKLYLYLTHQPNGDVDTTYIDAGNAVHNYMEDHINGNGKTVEEYLEKYNVSPEMYERVEKCISNGEKYMSLKGSPEVTEYTKFTTPKGRNINLQSRIDLQCDDADLDEAGKKVVIDWKTGKTIDKPEYRLQMHVYRFVRNQEYDAMLVSLLTGETLVLKKSPKNYIPNMCDKYVDTIENSDFKRNPKPTCSRFCPYYKDYCSPGHEYDVIVPRMTWDNEKKEWVE